MSCNFGNEYTSSRPNFCGKCGKPFIDSSIASTPSLPVKQVFTPTIVEKPTGKLNKMVQNEEFDYPEDATEVPQIDKIECQLTVSNLRPNRESGKDVFNAGSLSEAREVLGKQPIKSKKTSKSEQIRKNQEFKEQFKNQLSKKSRNERDSIEIGG